MNRFPGPLRFHLTRWLAPTDRGWVQPLVLGLAVLLVALVCLHAAPAVAAQAAEPQAQQAEGFFCILFKSVCLPEKGYAAPDAADSDPLPWEVATWLDSLPPDGEAVRLVPDDSAATPRFRLALVEWLREQGVRLPAWLDRE
jgi:hypothetical protein